jgi:hypothetical protein
MKNDFTTSYTHITILGILVVHSVFSFFVKVRTHRHNNDSNIGIAEIAENKIDDISQELLKIDLKKKNQSH